MPLSKEGIRTGEVDQAADVGVAPLSAESGPRRNFGGKYVVDGAVVAFLLLLVVAFCIALPDKFPTWANVQTILGNQAVPALLALAVITPLVAGEFDLSVGGTLGATAVFTAYATEHGMAPVSVLLLALAIGVLVGVMNGLLVTWVRVSAFIATLGMGTILTGVNLKLTNGAVIFNGIGPSLKNLANTSVLGLPIVVFYAVAVAFVLWYFLEWTPFGRYMRATGSGREAARLSGVRTQKWLFLSFVVSAVIAAFAGFMATAQLGSAVPTVGPDYLLPAYAAAFLGAATIHAGRFNVWGTMVGVLILAVGINGLNLAGVAFWVPPVFNGVALIIAVSFAAIVGRQKRGNG
jgi:ribose transport system permease protein